MKISVITVVRNDVEHIEQTLLSVLGQDYADKELIVIDGGSTDGTTAVIERYADRLAYWVSEPDGGIYPAMNKGLRKATGDWVNFMNSGDLFATEQVLSDLFGEEGVLARHLAAHPEAKPWVIGGNTVNVFSDGREVIHHAESAEVIPLRLPFSHQASFVRIQPETFCFGEQYRYAADYKLFYDLYFAYGASAFLIADHPIARYRQEDSLTMSPQNQRAIKREYLSIQSAHRTWHWWKEWLKWRLM
jgi:glycosyltransferase involved in cell wall biosynthesis